MIFCEDGRRRRMGHQNPEPPLTGADRRRQSCLGASEAIDMREVRIVARRVCRKQCPLFGEGAATDDLARLEWVTLRLELIAQYLAGFVPAGDRNARRRKARYRPGAPQGR
jgi:hypothetical protein